MDLFKVFTPIPVARHVVAARPGHPRAKPHASPGFFNVVKCKYVCRLERRPVEAGRVKSLFSGAIASMRFKKNRLILTAAGALWLLVIGAGIGTLWAYESTPGVAAATPDRWPAASRIKPAADRATLVMSAHPHCPCTRASIGELSRLMTQAQGRLTAYVLFVKPPGFSDGWEKTDLWASAAAIPGVTPVRDDGGVESDRFHAATSGQTALYDSAGNLLFSGGITGARGHAGDNAGRAAVVSLLNDGEAERRGAPVFGCPLSAQTECPAGMEVGREKNNH